MKMFNRGGLQGLACYVLIEDGRSGRICLTSCFGQPHSQPANCIPGALAGERSEQILAHCREQYLLLKLRMRYSYLMIPCGEGVI